MGFITFLFTLHFTFTALPFTFTFHSSLQYFSLFQLHHVCAKSRRTMTTFSTSREIPASVEQVFAALSNPERLARWWGPAGFTNTFSVCEFKSGGRWSYVMHGPNGGNYPNESLFAEIEAPRKVVLEHVSKPKLSFNH